MEDPTAQLFYNRTRKECEEALWHPAVRFQHVWENMNYFPSDCYDLIEKVFPGVQFPVEHVDAVKETLGIPYNKYRGTHAFRSFPYIYDEIVTSQIRMTGQVRFALWQIEKYYKSKHWQITIALIKRLFTLYKAIDPPTALAQKRLVYLQRFYTQMITKNKPIKGIDIIET
jgi:hypothetical protein